MKWLYGGVGEAGGEHAVTDDLDLEPVDIGDFSHGDFHLVGHGDVTNGACGKVRTIKGCSRVELHNRITLDGKNFRGKVYMRKVFYSCYKPSCPVCYKYGWAVREAGRIEARLKEASKRFGQVEHIVASVPVKDYGLTYKQMRKKIVKVLKQIGILGGALIFHGFRYNLSKYWYWSSHFHVLGFIRGGYRRCRRCKGGDCYACGGVEGRCYNAYWATGYIVRVLDKRKTVNGTAWYQLNHSSYDITKKHFRIATWFGVCSYTKLKVAPQERKSICPICKHDLVEHRYLGSCQAVLDWFASTLNASHDKRAGLFDLEGENGRVVWVEKAKRRGW